MSANLLLIDDDEDICTALGDGLRKLGFNVKTYSNPRQALDEFEKKRYDKIILDIRMPQMNGFDVAKQIWAKDPEARICFLSAFEIYEKEAKMVFKDLKDVCFIKKPILASELARRITENMHDVKIRL